MPSSPPPPLSWSKGLVLVLLIAVAGCASTHETVAAEPPATSEAGYFQLRTPSSLVEVKVTPEALSGPAVQVQRTEQGFRGFAFNQTVDLRAQENKVTGFIGSRPVELFITSEDSGVVLRGTYAGTLGRLELTPEGVNGTVGACGYSLRKATVPKATYDGQRTCRTPPEPITLTIPSALMEKPTGEMAAVLALLLGG